MLYCANKNRRRGKEEQKEVNLFSRERKEEVKKKKVFRVFVGKLGKREMDPRGKMCGKVK